VSVRLPVIKPAGLADWHLRSYELYGRLVGPGAMPMIPPGERSGELASREAQHESPPGPVDGEWPGIRFAPKRGSQSQTGAKAWVSGRPSLFCSAGPARGRMSRSRHASLPAVPGFREPAPLGRLEVPAR